MVYVSDCTSYWLIYGQLFQAKIIYYILFSHRTLIYHEITQGTAMTATNCKPDFKLTTDTPYLALTGELWAVYYDIFEENWPGYNCTARYVTLELMKTTRFYYHRHTFVRRVTLYTAQQMIRIDVILKHVWRMVVGQWCENGCEKKIRR